MEETDEALALFLRGFHARDLAEPLLTFDEATPVAVIRSASAGPVGVRRAGMTAGWLSREDLAGDKESPPIRALDSTLFVSDTASLDQVIAGLGSAPCVFVRALGQIGGVIERRDLHKPAMRMWLFGLVTILELRVTALIDEVCPQEGWRKYLSAGRLQKANDLQAERRLRGQQPSVLDCLQFADKGQIVARNERLREQTRFNSKSQVEKFVAALQDLRNNLAHAQDISGDWNVIHELGTNLYRIVLGPSGPSP